MRIGFATLRAHGRRFNPFTSSDVITHAHLLAFWCVPHRLFGNFRRSSDATLRAHVRRFNPFNTLQLPDPDEELITLRVGSIQDRELITQCP